MKKHVTLHKKVGQTPLQCVEVYRTTQEDFIGIPMAYAGRLDPMAEGKLLVVIGEECKVQEKYHALDKEYLFEVVFGVTSDTADVLGLLETCSVPSLTAIEVRKAASKFVGEIELPYPHFSSKTVKGKPLHIWKLEGTIDTIEIPTKKSTIYSLKLERLSNISAQEVYVYATEKIKTIPRVIEESKALGRDFRRTEVRAAWEQFLANNEPEKQMYIAQFSCVCSSGTYMRTLAQIIAKELNTCGLAYSINRTKIGMYRKLPFGLGYWRKQF